MTKNQQIIHKLVSTGVLPNIFPDDRSVATLVCVGLMTKLNNANLIKGGGHATSDEGMKMVDSILDTDWKLPKEDVEWFVDDNEYFNHADPIEITGIKGLLVHLTNVGMDAVMDEMMDMWKKMPVEDREQFKVEHADKLFDIDETINEEE